MDDKKLLGDKGEKGRNDAKARYWKHSWSCTLNANHAFVSLEIWLEADSQSNGWKLTCVNSKNSKSRVVSCTDLLPWLWPPRRRRARVEDLLEKGMQRRPQEAGIP